MLFAITILHGILAVALIAALGWTALKLAGLSTGGSTSGAAWASLISALLLNMTGAYSYISYRLRDPGTPRSIILETEPWVHRILFESMEYIGLVIPILIAVATAAIVIYRRRQLLETAPLRGQISRIVYITIFLVLLMAIAGFIPSSIAMVK
jgi:hypothetical protein